MYDRISYVTLVMYNRIYNVTLVMYDRMSCVTLVMYNRISSPGPEKLFTFMGAQIQNVPHSWQNTLFADPNAILYKLMLS